MGIMARQLFKMETKNNELILQLLRASLHPSVRVELSEAACHEEVTKHASILLILPNGETINQYRCRMRWFMSAPGQPTLPMTDLSGIDPHQSAWGIATVVNELVLEMQEERATRELDSEVSTNFDECLQCGEATNGESYCDSCY